MCRAARRHARRGSAGPATRSGTVPSASTMSPTLMSLPAGSGITSPSIGSSVWSSIRHALERRRPAAAPSARTASRRSAGSAGRSARRRRRGCRTPCRPSPRVVVDADDAPDQQHRVAARRAPCCAAATGTSCSARPSRHEQIEPARARSRPPPGRKPREQQAEQRWRSEEHHRHEDPPGHQAGQRAAQPSRGTPGRSATTSATRSGVRVHRGLHFRSWTGEGAPTFRAPSPAF